ncbi:E3 ubiquitin-protein ligase synoviolin [Pancytospora philotis]|nr:E3 ubiquitin-protein ligase synoviolin [Pancytospora philotis]
MEHLSMERFCSPIMKQYVAAHFGVFALACAMLCKERTLYGVLVRIATNNLLHLLHTSLAIHIILAIGGSITNAVVGSLAESEQTVYRERVYALGGDILMIISFFPSDLPMISLIYFAVLYCFRSFAWSFGIKMLRACSWKMLVSGYVAIAASLMCAWMCCSSLRDGFSIFVLFALEYSLVAFELLRSTSVMLLDLCRAEEQRSITVLFIGIFYYLVRSIAYLAFVVIVSTHHRFPASTARSFVASLMKLRKKLKLLCAYRQLCADLRGIPDTPLDTTCPICQEHLSVGKVLRCRHAFHSMCLRQWCERESSCPICRTELAFKREERIITDDEILVGVPVD